MLAKKKNIIMRNAERHIEVDMTDSFTCSFTEFYPFCLKLYYFSSLKDFNTIPQA